MAPYSENPYTRFRIVGFEINPRDDTPACRFVRDGVRGALMGVVDNRWDVRGRALSVIEGCENRQNRGEELW